MNPAARSALFVATLTAIVLGACLLAVWPKLAHQPQQSEGQSQIGTDAAASQTLVVVKVVDGDTFTGRTAARKLVRVRLLGIDAPEVAHDGQPAACGGDAASKALASLIQGQEVKVLRDPPSNPVDRFGRTLGYVEFQGADVAVTLIDKGMVEAWYPSSEPEPSRFAAYAAAEQAARQKGAGQWRRCQRLGR